MKEEPKQDIEIFIDGIANPSEPNQALIDAAERLKGKELFKESNDRARKILSEIKSLPKQETLEDAAKTHAFNFYEKEDREVGEQSFINGYKFKQEQILDFLYSEITERRDYSASKMCEKVIEFIKKNY